MRLDRQIALLVQPRPASWSSFTGQMQIPILMYHSVAATLDTAPHPYYRTVTSPATFRRHMDLLRERNTTVISLREAVARLSSSTPGASFPDAAASAKRRSGPSRFAAITFDDGLADFFTTAFPILSRYGFCATVFVSTGFIGKSFLTGQPSLRADQLRELGAAGVDFGSHTVTHPQLRTLAAASIRQELRHSREALEHLLVREVRAFSYPYRFPEEDPEFVSLFRDLLTEQGYSHGVTTRIGRSRSSDDPLFMKRLPMNDCDDDRLFQAKLDGAYDWMHAGQLLYKRARAIPRNCRRAAAKALERARL